jgi:hypothetical protein
MATKKNEIQATETETKKKPYYKVNIDNKTIVVDDNVKATATEKQDVIMYMTAGYKLRHKSEKRAQIAADRVKKNGGKVGKKKEETKAEETKAE